MLKKMDFDFTKLYYFLQILNRSAHFALLSTLAPGSSSPPLLRSWLLLLASLPFLSMASPWQGLLYNRPILPCIRFLPALERRVLPLALNRPWRTYNPPQSLACLSLPPWFALFLPFRVPFAGFVFVSLSL